MATTQYYVNPAIAGNSGTGTIGDPFGDLQYALDTIVRDATDGDQINILAGTAEVLAAPLSLATYGAPSTAFPLILRGYTSAANDGGIAEIDCNGATMWAASYGHKMLVDLNIHTFGDNDGILLGDQGAIVHCEVSKGASSPSGKVLISGAYNGSVVDCYLHGPGTGAAKAIANVLYALDNYIVMDSSASNDRAIDSGAFCISNIIVCASTTTIGMNALGFCKGNVVYNLTAGTSYGINATGNVSSCVFNNIVAGFSGAGGIGIRVINIGTIGYNAFFNCTTNITATDQMFNDMTANDVALAADPFVNAATGNFALTDAAKLALRSAGLPSSYLGASTDPHITIGAVQYGAAEAGGGGAVSISPIRGNL